MGKKGIGKLDVLHGQFGMVYIITENSIQFFYRLCNYVEGENAVLIGVSHWVEQVDNSILCMYVGSSLI